MRRLLLIRHAKSSHKMMHLDDHDRPLNQRGQRDLHTMSHWFLEHESHLPLMISSTAKRAWVLAKAIHQISGIPLESNEYLYTFDERQLLTVIHHLPDTIEHIALVGHNPAMTIVANQLGFHQQNIPTSGVVAFNSQANRWSQVMSENTQLEYFVAPKLLASQ